MDNLTEKAVTNYNLSTNFNVLHETRLIIAQALYLLDELNVATSMMNRLNVKTEHVKPLIFSSNQIKECIVKLNNAVLTYNNRNGDINDLIHDVKQACFTLKSFVIDTDRLLQDVLRS